MRTGDSCERTGIYRSGCPCGAKVTIALGTQAPVCPICQRACNWSLGALVKRSSGGSGARSVEMRRQIPKS